MEGWFGHLLAVPGSEKSGLYRVKADKIFGKFLETCLIFIIKKYVDFRP